MKTTLDLPDELMREVKLCALRENKKLKDAVAELLERGLRSGVVRRISRPVRLKRGGPMTIEVIESAIGQGRD